MRIIILGSGDVGFYLAEKLSSEGHIVSVVENKKEAIEKLSNSLDIHTVYNSCLDPEALKEANIHKADILIAATDSDETNLLSCLLAKELGTPYTIARIKYLQENYGNYKFPYHKIGVDQIINSELSAANDIISIAEAKTNITKIIGFENDKLQLILLDVDDYPKFINQSMQNLRQSIKKFPFLISMVIRKGETHIPKGDFILKAEDKLYVMIRAEDLPKVQNLLGKNKKKNQNIMIAGGSLIGYEVAKKLESVYSSVKLIEEDLQQTEFLVENLNETLIIKGDGTEVKLLIEEGIKEADFFIAATDDDKKNLLAALLAKNNGAKKIVCLVRRADYVKLVSELGIDYIVSPRVSVSDEIIQLVRTGKVSSFYTVPETGAETFEQEITNKCHLTQSPLKDLNISNNILVGGIIKKTGKVFIPDGNYICEIGDKVVLISKENATKELDDLFKL